MPVLAELLLVFISLRPGVTTTTINNWVAGLHFFHTRHNAPWPKDLEILSRTRAGAFRLVPVLSKHAKHPPVTIDHMETLFEALDHSKPKDVAIWAIASIAFWPCCRLQELTTDGEFLPYKHVARDMKRTFGHTRATTTSPSVKFASLRIPWGKTTTTSGATISITARPESALCPTRALKQHLALNSNTPGLAPFFAYKKVNLDSMERTEWVHLDKLAFMAECNRVWVDNGLQPMSEHNFRIGGTTYLQVS